jgi:Tol biopolymer transport system component
MKKLSLFSVVSTVVFYLILGLTDFGEAASKGKPGGGGGTQIDPAIVYVANQGAGTKIMVANADGTNRIVVVDNGTRNSRPSWSPDGSRILFTSDVNGPGVYCVTINRTTGQPLHSPARIVALSGDAHRFWAKPVWSPKPVPYPGGTHKIAYANYKESSGFLSIYLQDILDCESPLGPPTELRFVPDDEHYKHYAYPSWSPDSDKLAVLAKVTGDQAGEPFYDVQVITLGLCAGNICDTERKSLIQDFAASQLRLASTDFFFPEWGGITGEDIVVDAWRNLIGEPDYNVWIIPVDDPASAAMLTTDTSNRDDGGPSWSPNNMEIIYSSRPNECKQVCQGTSIIVKRNVDGTGYTELIKEKYHVGQPKWWGLQ